MVAVHPSCLAILQNAGLGFTPQVHSEHGSPSKQLLFLKDLGKPIGKGAGGGFESCGEERPAGLPALGLELLDAEAEGKDTPGLGCGAGQHWHLLSRTRALLFLVTLKCCSGLWNRRNPLAVEIP